MRRQHSCFTASSAAAALVSAAAAQPCEPGWHYFIPHPNHLVHALPIFHEGSHPSLFVVGNYSHVGGLHTGNVARWDGEVWSPVGNLLFDRSLAAAIVFDDGTGPALYVGGGVEPAPGVYLGVARWNGTEWSYLGSGLDGSVRCFAIHDDGYGSALYAGGDFSIPGHQERNLARWTGTTWVPVGGGTNNFVDSMISFDDGAGASLYIKGPFTSVGGTPIAWIARWNGSQWFDARGSWNSGGSHFVVFDDGSGPSLYMAGWVSISAGQSIYGLFKQVAGDWVVIGVTNNGPRSVAVWDDGRGPALYLGGSFRFLNGQPIPRVARWDGTNWTGTGAEFLAGAINTGSVWSMGAYEDACGPMLVVGGHFNYDGSNPSSRRYLARFNPAPPPGCYPNCDSSSVPPILNVEDFTCFITEFAGALGLPPNQQLDHYANCDQSTTPPILNVNDFTCFINAFAQGCP
jgi:trimeric autotransporter adhesin